MRSPTRKRGTTRHWPGLGVIALWAEGSGDVTEYGAEPPLPPKAALRLVSISRDTTGKEGNMLRAGEESAKDQEQWLYERAHARVQAIKGFYVHAIAFLVVNIAVVALNALVGGAWWFYWPLIGWGIGLGLQIGRAHV